MKRLVIIGFCLVFVSAFMSTTVSAAQVSRVTVPVTYQVFHHGWMLWRTDGGDIDVFVEDGRFMRFAADQYGWLPSNPLARNYDPSKIVPIMGFGQVWGNFPEVRLALGDARLTEWSYQANIDTLTPFVFQINDYNGSLLQVIGSRWMSLVHTVPNLNVTPTPPPLVIPTVDATYQPMSLAVLTGAAYQQYEQGFMIWRADTQDILVFHGSTSGDMLVYPYSYYAVGDENAAQTPPAGLINPINGFGRVWANFARERQLLGWARTTETAYDTLVTLTNGSYLHGTITGPDGIVIYFDGGSWSY